MITRLTHKVLLAIACCFALVCVVPLSAGAQGGIIKKGAQGVKKGVETGVEKTKEGAEYVGRETKEGVEAVGRETKELFTGEDKDTRPVFLPRSPVFFRPADGFRQLPTDSILQPLPMRHLPSGTDKERSYDHSIDP